jgi:hypothetical protein
VRRLQGLVPRQVSTPRSPPGPARPAWARPSPAPPGAPQARLGDRPPPHSGRPGRAARPFVPRAGALGPRRASPAAAHKARPAGPGGGLRARGSWGAGPGPGRLTAGPRRPRRPGTGGRPRPGAPAVPPRPCEVAGTFPARSRGGRAGRGGRAAWRGSPERRDWRAPELARLGRPRGLRRDGDRRPHSLPWPGSSPGPCSGGQDPSPVPAWLLAPAGLRALAGVR